MLFEVIDAYIYIFSRSLQLRFTKTDLGIYLPVIGNPQCIQKTAIRSSALVLSFKVLSKQKHIQIDLLFALSI